MRGWSLNLSSADPVHTVEVELPVEPIFVTRSGEVVIEVVIWSEIIGRWVHLVSECFERELPPEHVQVTVGDLAWVRQVVRLHGPQAIHQCVYDLQQEMVPDHDG